MDLISIINVINLKYLPFYNVRLNQISQFESIPLVSKNELLQSQSDFPPYGRFTDDKLAIEQIYRTSGTTGEPLLLTFTKGDINLITDIGADCFKYAGMGSIGSREVVINCLNLSMWAGGFFDAQSMMKTGAQVVNFGTGNTTELLKLIFKLSKKFKVSIHCTPSYLPAIKSRLQMEFNQNPEELNIWRFYLGAEGGLQNGNFRDKLKKEWQSEVYNANYGMSEVCSIMASADDNNVLRFSPLFLNNYFCEIKLISGEIILLKDVVAGSEGEMIITSLHKQSQPMLRYETKENIRIIKSNNDGVFFEIIGRKDDMIVVKGINFFPEQVRGILTNYTELSGAFKIEATKKDELITHLNLICEIKTSQSSSNNKLKAAIHKAIRDELTISCDINFVYEIPLQGNKVKLLEIIKEK